MTCNGEFVGKEFLCGGVFVLDNVVTSMNNEWSTFAYIVESITLWHSRLGHVNATCLKRLKYMNLLPNLVDDGFSKCEVYVEAKHI